MKITKERQEKRNRIIRRMVKDDPEVMNKTILEELEREGIPATPATIVRLRKEIKKEETGKEEVEDMKEYKTLQNALNKLDSELKKVEKLRKNCESESASAQYSRLLKDIVVKRAELSKELFALKLQYKETKKVIYQVRIGEFPVADEKSIKKKKSDDGNGV